MKSSMFFNRSKALNNQIIFNTDLVKKKKKHPHSKQDIEENILTKIRIVSNRKKEKNPIANIISDGERLSCPEIWEQSKDVYSYHF